MTAKEYAKTKGVELVGKISRYTYKKDGCRWICFIDEVGNEVSKKMKTDEFELRTAEEKREEAKRYQH